MEHMGGLISRWQGANARERGILLLVFSPLLVCAGGLIFSIVSFVLFVLPSFLLRLLGWGVLAALFNAGGNYCYEHLTGKTGTSRRTQTRSSETVFDASFTDVPYTEDAPGASYNADDEQARRQDIHQRWFENVRRNRWKK